MTISNLPPRFSPIQLAAARRYKSELDGCTIVELQYRLQKQNKAGDDLPSATRKELTLSLFALRFGEEKSHALYTSLVP